ncbi:hypothetical protein D3C87_1232000 [compost metagenome]
MLGQRIDDVLHPQRRVRRVLAVRVARDQDLESVVGGTRGLRVAFAQVLAGEAAQPAQVVVEVDQALEVVGVINVGMARVQLDEAVDGGQRGGSLAILVVGERGVDLRLLGVAAERVAAFQLFIELDGACIVAAIQRILGFRI